MKKQRIITIIFAGLAVGFAIADIILFCLNDGNMFLAGMPFFLCLIGFGVATITACVIILVGEKKKDFVICSKCGGRCSKTDAFCPSCGTKL